MSVQIEANRTADKISLVAFGGQAGHPGFAGGRYLRIVGHFFSGVRKSLACRELSLGLIFVQLRLLIITETARKLV
jgi:hypothetical protein